MNVKKISIALNKSEENIATKKKIERSILLWQLLVWVTAILKIINYCDGYLFVYHGNPDIDWDIYSLVNSCIEFINVVDVNLVIEIANNLGIFLLCLFKTHRVVKDDWKW